MTPGSEAMGIHMTDSPPWRTDGSKELVVDIVETLERCGLGRDEYQLYDEVDVDALEQLLTSTSDDIEVRFTVEGIRLAVTSDGANVLVGDPPE